MDTPEYKDAPDSRKALLLKAWVNAADNSRTAAVVKVLGPEEVRVASDRDPEHRWATGQSGAERQHLTSSSPALTHHLVRTFSISVSVGWQRGSHEQDSRSFSINSTPRLLARSGKSLATECQSKRRRRSRSLGISPPPDPADRVAHTVNRGTGRYLVTIQNAEGLQRSLPLKPDPVTDGSGGTLTDPGQANGRQ